MNCNYGIAVGWLAMSTLFIGCSNTSKLETGATDYRSTTVPSSATDAWGYKYYIEQDLNELPDALIRPGDSVSIKVMQTYICDFSEKNSEEYWKFWDRPEKVPAEERCNDSDDASIYRGTRGEIALLATAYELGKGKGVEFSKGAAKADSARVVYYDDDVRESGQYLNFSNLPVYGPITYEGGPMFLRFIILELDEEENGVTSSLLKTLADIGKVAYPPASSVLGTLEQIGTSLINRNGDDVEFRYVMTFDGYGGQTTSHAPLMYGNYVFLKHWDRSKQIEWNSYHLNKHTGRLQLKGASQDSELKKYTYLSIKISKNEPAMEQDVAQTLAQFKSLDSPDTWDLSNISTSMEFVGKNVKNQILYNQLRTDLSTIKSWPTKSASESLAIESIVNGLCSKPDTDEISTTTNLTDAQVSYLMQGLYKALPEVLSPEKMTIAQLRNTACKAPLNSESFIKALS